MMSTGPFGIVPAVDGLAYFRERRSPSIPRSDAEYVSD